MSIPAGGDGYGSRNAYTYGIGFRPTAGNYSLDLNFATPEGGGSDVALWVSYRF